MRFTHLAAAGIGIAAAAAVAFTGSGEASALTLLTSFDHTETLSNGKLTVKVKNDTLSTATCWVSVHDASKELELIGDAAAVNTLLGTGIPSGLLDSARADAAQGALKILADGSKVLPTLSMTKTWDSKRSDTSYAIYQECTVPGPLNTVNGMARVYKVTGSGHDPDAPGGDSSGGSLGDLLGGLF